MFDDTLRPASQEGPYYFVLFRFNHLILISGPSIGKKSQKPSKGQKPTTLPMAMKKHNS